MGFVLTQQQQNVKVLNFLFVAESKTDKCKEIGELFTWINLSENLLLFFFNKTQEPTIVGS